MRYLLLLLLTGATVFSQAQQINGLTKDENGAPLNGVTVSLIKATDSSTTKLAVTKSTGVYSFTGIKEGNYRILVTYVGYKPAFSTVISFHSADVTVPEFKLSKIPGNRA